MLVVGDEGFAEHGNRNKEQSYSHCSDCEYPDLVTFSKQLGMALLFCFPI